MTTQVALTVKQTQFVAEYRANGGDQLAAAARVYGKNNSHAMASSSMRNKKIRAELARPVQAHSGPVSRWKEPTNGEAASFSIEESLEGSVHETTEAVFASFTQILGQAVIASRNRTTRELCARFEQLFAYCQTEVTKIVEAINRQEGNPTSSDS